MNKTCGDKPCNDCPFRKKAVAGWLGGASPERFMLQILADDRLPCHTTINYEHPAWHSRWVNGEEGQLCAGALIMMANIMKSPRDPEVQNMKPSAAVFDNAEGFIAFHRSTGARSWDDEEDERGKAAWAVFKSIGFAAPALQQLLDGDEPKPQYLETPRNPGADDGRCALCKKRGLTEDQRCYGCGYTICDDCNADDPQGQHLVVDHDQTEWNV